MEAAVRPGKREGLVMSPGGCVFEVCTIAHPRRDINGAAAAIQIS
jgi:hypothetical protein